MLMLLLLNFFSLLALKATATETPALPHLLPTTLKFISHHHLLHFQQHNIQILDLEVSDKNHHKIHVKLQEKIMIKSQ